MPYVRLLQSSILNFVLSHNFLDFLGWLKQNSFSVHKESAVHLKASLGLFSFQLSAYVRGVCIFFIAYLMFLIDAIMQSKGNTQLPA